jgi:hypothetical protein
MTIELVSAESTPYLRKDYMHDKLFFIIYICLRFFFNLFFSIMINSYKLKTCASDLFKFVIVMHAFKWKIMYDKIIFH